MPAVENRTAIVVRVAVRQHYVSQGQRHAGIHREQTVGVATAQCDSAAAVDRRVCGDHLLCAQNDSGRAAVERDVAAAGQLARKVSVVGAVGAALIVAVAFAEHPFASVTV